MVRSGQAPDGSALATVGYNNPARPQLGVETLTHSELTSRLSLEELGRPHRPDFHRLTLVTGGRGVAMVDFVEYACAAGTLLHVRPGQVQRIPRPLPHGSERRGAPDDSGVLEAAIVLFTGAFPSHLKRIAPLLGHPLGPAARTVPERERAGISRALDELAVEYRRAVEEAEAAGPTIDLLRQLLGALLLRIARLPGPDGPDEGDTGGIGGAGGAGDDAYRRFLHELERSFTDTRSTADYAARIGYSPRTLNRVCQAATGRTAKTLIDARVVLEAKRLLAHTTLPVAAIGRRLGFTEPTNFGKFFTRETGGTPGAFRTREGAFRTREGAFRTREGAFRPRERG
ncbi:helix-turn-helix transcriptional regulator [Streptomyces sp. NPDC001928]|uniref:AraC family transcriptional regulator n=1 Tax=Streptomyces sp. NPDC001928 TaxID=3154404 RepID=UPI0033167089